MQKWWSQNKSKKKEKLMDWLQVTSHEIDFFVTKICQDLLLTAHNYDEILEWKKSSLTFYMDLHLFCKKPQHQAFAQSFCKNSRVV